MHKAIKARPQEGPDHAHPPTMESICTFVNAHLQLSLRSYFCAAFCACCCA